MKKVAVVDKTRCVACGVCTKKCPRQAISIYRGCHGQVDALRCVGCGLCGKVCPAGCIRGEERGETI